MPEYRYEIITKDGKTERGKISAASQLEALQLLNSQGFVVTSIKPISKTRKRKRSLFPIQPKELSLFSRQLATMVSSGVRIRDALQVLSKQTMFSRRFRKILVEVVLLIESGEGFSDALEKTRVFDELFVNLVRAGETGGVLDEALQRVAEFYEGMVDLQNQVKSAMSYPLFMMLLPLVSLELFPSSYYQI